MAEPKEIPEHIRKRLNSIEDELRVYLNERDVDLAYYIVSNRESLDEDKSTWSLLDYFHISDKYRDLVARYRDHPEEEYTDDELRTLIDILNAQISMVKRMAHLGVETTRALKTLIGATETRLTGKATARLFALKMDCPYLIYTEKAVYKLFYNKDLEYFIQIKEFCAPGVAQPPDEPLRFLGNVQESGVIFHPHELPLITTGDKMAFSKHGQTDPIYVSPTVNHVVSEMEVN